MQGSVSVDYKCKLAVSLHSATVSHSHSNAHEDTQTQMSTSLNSGLRVFFMTAVLCLDFFWTSGFRYLRQRNVIQPYVSQVIIIVDMLEKNREHQGWL